MSPQDKSEVLKWLASILAERFGHLFSLQEQIKGSVTLTLPGSPQRLEIETNEILFGESGGSIPCTRWDATLEGWRAVSSLPLPAPGASNLPLPLVVSTEMGLQIRYDILGLTYWMLCRHEEIGSTDLDQHGRFPATSSHAFKYKYLERPVVDEWLDILGQAIQRIWLGIVLKQATFSIRVSHDVDAPSRYAFRSKRRLLRAIGGDLSKRLDFRSALIAIQIWFKTKTQLDSKDPYNTFDWIMDLSDKNGLKSAFYFICGHTGYYDVDYELEHPAIRKLLRHIHQRGHEIGLHPSYGTYQKPNLILQEAVRLRTVIDEEGIEQRELGGRMHYLRWKHPTTLQAWNDAGLTYDSTLGYADRPGFRCGTCFEYPAFNPTTKKVLRLRIRPLIAMECSVISPPYMDLGVSNLALRKFSQIKHTCQIVGGCFTLLWHNSQFDSPKKRQMYQKLLKFED